MRRIKGKPRLVLPGMAVWVFTVAVVGTNAGSAHITALLQGQQPVGGYDRSPIGTHDRDHGDDGFDAVRQKLLKEQLEKRNKLRQEQLAADTERLLKLATELKTEVDKSNKDTMSLTVIKKSEEIEKLARSVKDKMKNAL